MGFVNIIIHDETREKLNKLKNNPRESYNDVIVKLINEHDRSKEE
ncbi:MULTISPECIES: antitoxin VapB family protein [unclassified Acidiplasma]|jgi:predicted CopG family antitoxin|nr:MULTISPECIES: antitoxin VapB family protein [unclassified Acidiplasma]WMT55496.1 MAG: antitoxin VapB family protein [Acidiplasma sp.]